MTMTPRQIALLKVAVKRLGLTDAMYRSALAQIGGVTSGPGQALGEGRGRHPA